MTLGKIGLFTLTAGAICALAACGPAEKKAAEAPAAPAAYRVYVTNEVSNDLTVIDGATNAVIATVPVGMRPRGVRVSKDGKLLYVAVSGSPIAGPGVDEDSLPPPDKTKDGIAVFDIATNKVLRVITGVSDPEQMDIAEGKLFIASEDTGSVVVVDPASGAAVATVKTGDEPEGVNVSPDGKFVYVTSEAHHEVTIIDAAALKTVATLEVGERPRNTAFSADGKRAYVTGENDASITVIDTASHSIVNTVKLADKTIRPMDMALPGDGKKLFISGGRAAKVAVVDAASLSLTTTIPVGQRPWGMAASPDGKRLYTANGPSNDVSVIDTETLKVVATVKAGTRPWSAIAVAVP